MGGLLKSPTQRQYPCVRPGGTDEGQPDRQAMDVAHGHGQMRIACHGSQAGKLSAARRVGAHRVYAKGRLCAGPDKGIEAVAPDRVIQCSGGQALQLFMGLDIGGTAEIAPGVGFDKYVLAECSMAETAPFEPFQSCSRDIQVARIVRLQIGKRYSTN